MDITQYAYARPVESNSDRSSTRNITKYQFLLRPQQLGTHYFYRVQTKIVYYRQIKTFYLPADTTQQPNYWEPRQHLNEFTQKLSRGVLPNVTSCISRACLEGSDQQNFKSTMGPFLEKPFVKLWPAYSVKVVFPCVVKGITIKTTAKFRASIRLRFEDTKRFVSPEIRPERFGTFEKRAPKSMISLIWLSIIS